MLLKKILTTATILCLLLMTLGTPVAASAAGAPQAGTSGLIGVTPMFAYISRASTNLTISSSGLVTATGSITGYEGITDAVYIFLDLQYYSNGTWVTIGSWSDSFASYRGFLSGSCYVSPGFTYRVHGTYYAHSDYNYETIEQNSRSVYY